MPINLKSTTAAFALMLGAGAMPFAATAQSDTQSEEVEVEVIEEADQAAEATEEAVEESAEATEEAAEETAEATEEAAEESGEAAEEMAEESGEAAEEMAEEAEQATEVDTAGADDLEESQKQELEQAAAEGKEVPNPEMIIGVQKEGEWLSSELLDREITNQNDENIGDISGILFAEDGPKGVIVDVGGFLGLGEKEVAIKWGELQISDEAILVNASAEALENAPEFMTLEEKQQEAELQAQQEAAEAEQQAAQQSEGLQPATEEGAAVEEPATEEMVTEEEPADAEETTNN